jgi:hypothetical protein
VTTGGFDPSIYSTFDTKRLLPAFDAFAGVKVPTIDTKRLLPALDAFAGVKVPTIDTKRLLPAFDAFAGVKVPTIDTKRLLPALDAFAGVKVPTIDFDRLLPALNAMAGVKFPVIDTARFAPTFTPRLGVLPGVKASTSMGLLLDGYSGTSGTRLDALGALYGSLDDADLLPRIDTAADALTSRGALRWNYDEVRTSAENVVEQFQTLDPATQTELEARTEEAQEALSVTDGQLEQSLDLLGVRDALRFYGAAARTPLAFFAATLTGGGWYLLNWGSAGDAIVVGITVYGTVRNRLGALDTDE